MAEARYDDNGILIDDDTTPVNVGNGTQAIGDTDTADHASQHSNPMFQGNPAVPANQPSQATPDLGQAPQAQQPIPNDGLEAPQPEVRHMDMGDGIIGEVAKLLASSNVENVESIVQELKDNDGNISLTTQAQLTKDIGPEVTNLVVNQLRQEVEARNTANKEAKNAVMDYAHSKFGGSKDAATTWSDLNSFVQSGAAGLTASDVQGLNDLIAQGGYAAQLAVDKVFDAYKASPFYEKPASQVLNGESASGTPFQPLTRDDYFEQLDRTINQYGEHSPQANALHEQRRRSMAKGY